VISGLRALAKRAPLHPVLQDLNEILEDALPLVRGELSRHRIALRFARATDLPMVLADRVHLQQVFINLVLNAIQAMDGVPDRPRELSIRTFMGDGDEVRLAVQDCGVGIDPAHMGRFFEPFFTTRPEGMGMGLSISRSIVEAHGGRIWVSGNDGPGATFNVALPAQPTIP
jgi:signal transduction histidine kinase